MVILLHGEDTFRSRQKMKQMVERFKDQRDPQGINIIQVDASDLESGKLKEQMFTLPFLSEKRMVVVENFSNSNHDNLKEKILEKLKNNDVPESNVLIFWEDDNKPKDKLSKNLLKELSQLKYAQKFDFLEGVKLKNWIKDKVQEGGGKADRQALNYLTHHIGNDMWKLDNVIDQLLAYTKGKIETKDVQLFIEEKVDDDIFNLIDAIVEKNPKNVYNMIQEQYRQGNTPHYLFGMILRQFRIMTEIKDSINRGQNPSGKKFANKMGLHPYVLKKTKPLAQKYSMQKLENIYERLLDIDKKTKTGQHDQELLLDVFVGGLCKS